MLVYSGVCGVPCRGPSDPSNDDELRCLFNLVCVLSAVAIHQTQAAVKDGDIPADIVVALMEMSDALHKGSYSLQVSSTRRMRYLGLDMGDLPDN